MGGKKTEIVHFDIEDGRSIDLPVALVTGDSEGPDAVITAGIHGGEYGGIFAAIRLFRELSPSDIKGSVKFITVCDTAAFETRGSHLTAEGATLTFDSVANATGYEFYTVTETEGGKTYSLIDNYTVNATAGETVSVTFTSALLNAGEHTIAVRAVGDKMAGWFKSAPLETDGNVMTAVITVA